MSPPRHPVVRILAKGLALSVASTAACHGRATPPEPPPGNPPAPEPLPEPPAGNPPPPEPVPTANPPPPLPAWDDVKSDHPEGATNPPRPVLVALEDGSRCWKEWVGGMVPPAPEVLAAGGRVIQSADQAGKAEEIQCPADRVERVLRKHAEAQGKSAD